MLNKQELLKIANQPEERLLLAKVLDQAIFSLKKHENTFTDFCDPKNIEMIIKTVQGIAELNFFVFGGSEGCERRMIGFCPDYRNIDEIDFPIKAVKIISNTKFSKELSHRDFLGSVLGLGIDRSKVGDIFIFEDFTIVFVNEEIAAYISSNLERVGKAPVTTEVFDSRSIELPQGKTEEKTATVSSLRADALVGAAFNISRGKAQTLIDGEKVFVNWSSLLNGSKQLKEGDMISVRGLGRAKVSSIGGRTKKDRIVVTFLKYV